MGAVGGRWAVSVLAVCLAACTVAPPTQTLQSMPAKFSLPEGQTLFIIGQDNDTIAAYLSATNTEPGGVTSYTSLQRLEGLAEATDYGAGPIHLSALAEQHPHSVVALGLYLVDYLDEITAGKAEAQIEQLLNFLVALKRPVFLRFGYEFDGAWNHYDPEQFKAAWRYFRAKMQSAGVTNVALVWQSAAYCDGTYRAEPISAWYPGDEAVDWVALSYFTQSTCAGRPLEEILSFARERHKPVLIAEAAPQRYATGELTYSIFGRQFEPRTAEAIWDEWYAPFFAFIRANADVIRAVAYINTHWDEQTMWGQPYPNGYWGDSRVQANAEILAQWQTTLNQPDWLHGSPELFNRLGYNSP